MYVQHMSTIPLVSHISSSFSQCVILDNFLPSSTLIASVPIKMPHFILLVTSARSSVEQSYSFNSTPSLTLEV